MHISTGSALDFTAGRLDRAEVEFWKSHISMCGNCAQELANWRGLETKLKRSHLESATAAELEKTFNMFDPARKAAIRLPQVLATIVFDSFEQPAFAGARGVAAHARQLVLWTEQFDIHVKIWEAQQGRQLLGQIMPHPGNGFPGPGRLYLLRDGDRLDYASIDDIGEFYFAEIPDGDLSLQIDLPHLTVIGKLGQ